MPGPHRIWATVAELKGQTHTLRDIQQDLEYLELDGMPSKGG